MKSKILISILVLFSILTTSVFATDGVVTGTVLEGAVNSDVYVSEDNYTISGEVTGNAFITSDEFIVSDNSSVSGNIYVMANSVCLKSDALYSDAISKDGTYSIDKINSSATVQGSVFAICDEFTLEAGCEIYGDLYVLAKKVTIEKSSYVHGNVFVSSEELSLSGRVDNSVYATCDKFNMSYYGSIANDLNLTTKEANLNSVIRRNAYVYSDKINTSTDFLLYGNLEANSNVFDFSGEIDGNAVINSKEINFVQSKDDSEVKCSILGNLDYSAKKELQIDDSIVRGTTNYSKYSKSTGNKESGFKNFVLDLLTFMVYILVVAFVFKLINKNYVDKEHKITLKNILASFGIGILSLLITVALSILLIKIPFGVTLSFTLVFAYILLLFLAMPIFVLDIAASLNKKSNLFLSTIIISLVLFLITRIPVLGVIVMLLFIAIGVGRIIKNLFAKA